MIVIAIVVPRTRVDNNSDVLGGVPVLELRDPIWPQGQTSMPCPPIIVPIWRSVDLLAGLAQVGLQCQGRRYVVQVRLIHGLGAFA